MALKYLRFGSDSFYSTPETKYSGLKKMKNLLWNHAGEIPVVRIKTFANALYSQFKS